MKARIQRITRKYTDISAWFTLFGLKDVYDLIVGKNWYSTTRHLVDSNSVLHLLNADWSSLTVGRPAFIPWLSWTGLRPHQQQYCEVQSCCTAIAKAANINLIYAEETEWAMKSTEKPDSDSIFVIDIHQ